MTLAAALELSGTGGAGSGIARAGTGLAQTGDHVNARPGLLLLALVVALGYVVACAVWPWRACARCDGSGRRRSPSGRAWRDCRSCDGGGRKLRLGRRLWTALTDLGRSSRGRGH